LVSLNHFTVPVTVDMFSTTCIYKSFMPYRAAALNGNKTADFRLQWLFKSVLGVPAPAV